MKRYFYLLSVPLVAVLSGCESLSDNALYGKDGLIYDRGQQYQQAEVEQPLDIPGSLDASSIRDSLQIPEIPTVASLDEDGEYEVPRPDFFYAEAGNEVVNLAREGKEKYILVEQDPATVWQALMDFWSYNEMSLEISNPQRGLMETAWIEDDQEETGFFTELMRDVTFQNVEGPYKDKLRLLIARDDEPGRTAIRMQHLRVPVTEEGPADWSDDSQDLDYKSEMMYSLLHYLNKSTDSSTALAYQRRQQNGGAQGLLGRDSDGNPVLKLTTGVDQAWSWVDEAMADAEMDVGSANRDIGKYYITYTTSTPFNKDQQGGFWGFINWLHGDREKIKLDTDFLTSAMGIEDEDAAEEEAIRYSSKETLPQDPDDLSQRDGYKLWLGGRVIYVFGGDDEDVELNEETGTLEHTGRYQVKLRRHSNGVFVSVLTEEAEQAPSVVAEEILWNIKDHLPTS